MYGYEFEIDQKKEFHESLHANIMEHGLWFCKNAADLSGEIMQDVIVEFNLPYDCFTLQKMYAGIYQRIVDDYMKLFLLKMFDVLEDNLVRTKDSMFHILKEKILEADIGNEFSTQVTKMFHDQVASYLNQYYKIAASEESIHKFVSQFEKRINADIHLNIQVSVQFFKDHYVQLLEYLNELYEKNVEIDDVLGRCLFKLLEDKYDISVFYDGDDEVKYFQKEFAMPFISVIKEQVYGKQKYNAANNHLKKYIRTLLKKDIKITKYSFPIFFNDAKFKEHFCNYLMIILQSIQAFGQDAVIIREVNKELDKLEGDVGKFRPEHYYIIVDCWAEFLGRYNPELLKKAKEPLELAEETEEAGDSKAALAVKAAKNGKKKA